METLIQKIPDTSGLVTVTVLNKKLVKLGIKFPDHATYITTSEFNKLTAEKLAAR